MTQCAQELSGQTGTATDRVGPRLLVVSRGSWCRRHVGTRLTLGAGRDWRCRWVPTGERPR